MSPAICSVETARFCPLDYGFRWTDDWYDYDGKAAETAARAARDKRAAELKREGFTVKKRTRRRNLLSMGGIGSGHPHIQLFVPIYYVDVVR